MTMPGKMDVEQMSGSPAKRYLSLAGAIDICRIVM